MGNVETTAPQDVSPHADGPLTPRNEPGLNLLLEWPKSDYETPLRKALAISVGIHLLFFFIGVRLPSFVQHEKEAEPQKVTVKKTPLYFPTELTQKAPNKGKVAKSFELEDLLPPQPAQKRIVAPPPRRPSIAKTPPPVPPATPAKPKQQPTPEPPQIAANLPPNGILAPGSPTGVVPQPPLPEPPKQTLARQGSQAPPDTGLTLAPPKTTVQAAIESLAKNSQQSRTVVGNESEMVPLPRSPGALPSPAKLGSGLELLSNPEGIDFKPYLIQVLAAVRRNWFAVIPESARMGRRGRVIIQFAINRDGSIPKLVITVPSGAEPLDRAAVAGISASNPLPPLPRDYQGAQVRLQFIFNYNMPSH